jgi:hypothetical protein
MGIRARIEFALKVAIFRLEDLEDFVTVLAAGFIAALGAAFGLLALGMLSSEKVGI